MSDYPWRVYLLVMLGMILVSISEAATNWWVGVAFWVGGGVVIMKAVDAAVRSRKIPPAGGVS